jgi:hypothetical protein
MHSTTMSDLDPTQSKAVLIQQNNCKYGKQLFPNTLHFWAKLKNTVVLKK